MNRIAIFCLALYASSAFALTASAPLERVGDDISVAAGSESPGAVPVGYGEAGFAIAALKSERLSSPNTAATETADSSRNSVEGFSAMLLVTPDKDWQSKWNTPEKVTPRFTRAKTVKRTGSVTLLIFFANPEADQQNSVNVLCDIKTTRADGTVAVNETDLVALQGDLQGNPKNVRLARPVIEFIGEPQDPLGEWIVEVTVKDMVRGVSVPVRTSFIVEE